MKQNKKTHKNRFYTDDNNDEANRWIQKKPVLINFTEGKIKHTENKGWFFSTNLLCFNYFLALFIWNTFFFIAFEISL